MRPLDPFEITFSGVHLIEASAGTGKTYNIASLYIRAIIEARKTVDEILVVTYTEAATKELRERLMKRLRESIQTLQGNDEGEDSFLTSLKQHVNEPEAAIEKLLKAVHSFDEAAVYTIHGFCRHALQEHAFQSGAPFEAELIGDDTEIIGEIVADYWRVHVQKASEVRLRRPLLKFLLGKGCSPDSLTAELAGFAGKPYLKVEPDEVSDNDIEEHLAKLSAIFDELKAIWRQQKQDIYELLRSEQINGSKYRKDHLAGWMTQMSEVLEEEVPPIEPFNRFGKFSQSTVNDSLKASATKAPPEHPFFKKVDEYVSITEYLRKFDVIFKRNLFAHICERMQGKKEELQVYSYDDLLIRLKEALCHGQRGDALRKELRKTYSVALVDEFQDTDPIQYQIFKAIYAGADNSALFMIGDPKQSIYSFRGADIFAYLQAKNDAPPNKTYSLDHNYRSVPGLINGLNAVFSAHSNPFILADITYVPVQSGQKSPDRLTIKGEEAVPVEIRNITQHAEEPLTKKAARERSAEDTAAQIYELLANAQQGEAMIGKNRVQAKDIAVLVFSHRQATLVGNALKERGIKSVKHSRESVFNSEEARELYLLLKAVADPGDERLVITALSALILGYNANELFALANDERAWATKIEQFARWHTMWLNHGFAFMFRTLMQEEHIAEKVMQQNDGERSLTNLMHLAELMQQQEREHEAGLHSLLKWLLKKRKEDKKEIEEEQLRLESDENLVSVMTVHHSKGLEYPIVFCPFLWNAKRYADYGKPLVYHHPEDQSTVFLDFRGKQDPGRAQKRFLKAKETLAEGVRLAYVAMTRAKYKCVISWAHAKKSAHSPLGFLLLGKDESFRSLQNLIVSDESYQEVEPSLIQQPLAKLATHATIEAPHVYPVDEPISVLKSGSEKIKIEAQTFSRSQPLAKGWNMSSFSSLVRSEHEDFEPDYLQYVDDILMDEPQSDKAPPDSIFSFPKGPEPGTAIHHIFENIDFGDSSGWKPVIIEQLKARNITPKWNAVVDKMLRQTVEKSLLESHPALKLQAVGTKAMIAEMEFYFKVGVVNLVDLLSIIRPADSLPASLHGFAEEGFLKGFIDLTFQFDDRFYILDYKTNHLGNSQSHYSPENLRDEMSEKMYDLQYHLYLVALHRFLNQRLPDYSYEKHIGGAFYLFVRGIMKEGRAGIYYDCPPEACIKELDQYLKRRKK